MLDSKLIDILACPACEDRPQLEYTDNRLICSECGRIYPIHNGIPVLLINEAIKE
ncbi:MAG: Trm112 family protein [Armatimonadota bacterium]